MLLALLMLVSVLTYIIFVRKKRWRWLIAAGIFAGLAMGVKLLPALWLFVFFAGLIKLKSWKRIFRSLGYITRVLGFVFGAAVLTFWLVWPALWVKADLARSFERDVPSIVQDSHIELETSVEPVSPASFYLRTLLGRTTPFVLILVVGAMIVGVRQAYRSRGMPSILWLLLYALGFLVLITLAAKKS